MPADLLDRLTNYVDPFLPDWRKSLVGAKHDDVVEYVRLSGINPALGMEMLPESYRVWIDVAGRDDGGLLTNSLRADANLPDLIKFYADLHRFEPTYVCPWLPCVLKRKIGDEISFDLHKPSSDPLLFETSGDYLISFFASSWEALLMQCAVSTCEPLRFPARVLYSSSEADTLAAMTRHPTSSPIQLANAALKQLGFARPWFADDRHAYGFASDMTALIEVAGALPFTLVGADSKRVRATAEALGDMLGGRPVSLDQWR